MASSSYTIYDHLHQCTMRLSSAEEDGHGTGFFVAPGLILTCEHVVHDAYKKRQTIAIYWRGQRQSTLAQIIHVRPNVDLALLQTTLTDHPCVYLVPGLKPGDDLYTYGYPANVDKGDALYDRANGDSATFTCEGWTAWAQGQHVGQRAWIKFKGGQSIPGLSGAPLFNKRTGYICGLVATTRDEFTDLGGRGIATETILRTFPALEQQQQQFHQRDRRWLDGLETLHPHLTLLTQGQNALLDRSYGAAKGDIEKALTMLSEREQPKLVAKAKYLLALVRLDGQSPFAQTYSDMQAIESLLNSAIRIHRCYSYLRILAVFKNEFSHNGLSKYEHEALQLRQQANQLPQTADDIENLALLSQCQPDLVYTYANW
ncbi:MAG: hypothetical protein NVS4B12_28040 [Ktedonobacteraceae bacterium]